MWSSWSGPGGCSGPVVLLAPRSRELEGAITAGELEVTRSFDVRLLGRRATVFCLGGDPA